MIDADQQLSPLAQLVLIMTLFLVVAGVVLHGLTAGDFVRLWHNMVERASGPIRFRCVRQPSMATVLAILHGIRPRQSRAVFLDNSAQAGRTPRQAARRLERDSADRPARHRDGHDLPDPRAGAVLPERGGHRRTAACFHSQRHRARTGDTGRGQMAARHVGCLNPRIRHDDNTRYASRH